MSETARRFFIVSSSYEMDGPFQPLDRRDVPNSCGGSIVHRGVIAAGEVPKPVRLEQRDRKNAARKPDGILRILLVPVCYSRPAPRAHLYLAPSTATGI